MRMKEHMSQSCGDDTDLPSTSAPNDTSPPLYAQYQGHSCTRQSGGNVLQLLSLREVCPRVKRSGRRLWGDAAKQNSSCFGSKCQVTDAKLCLISWVEAESLRHLSAKYCPLVPPPRSTIAAAFSRDGKTLASTHGDHTVKIIDCQSGSCLKVLIGHRRTPWVVRFHPVYPEVLASGSLDHEVRLWDANTAECICSRDFYRPIASIAFHAQGELLAVASGHKLYIWQYNRRGETSSPSVVLRTRRSLRAVHFHPHAAPFLLTAEFSDSPDTPMTLATSPGYLHYPPPTVVFANPSNNIPLNNGALNPNEAPAMPLPCLVLPATLMRDNEESTSNADNMIIDAARKAEVPESSSAHPHAGTGRSDILMEPVEAQNSVTFEATFSSNADVTPSSENRPALDSSFRTTSGPGSVHPLGTQTSVGVGFPHTIHHSHVSSNTNLQFLLRNISVGQLHQFLPLGDSASWGLPFLQGWLMGQTQAGLPQVLPLTDGSGIRGITSDASALESETNQNTGTGLASDFRTLSRLPSRQRLVSRFLLAGGPAGDVTGSSATASNYHRDPQHGASAGFSEASLAAAAAAAELPFTVKLRIWAHDVENPFAPLEQDSCRLTIPHAVLCSEMGAHFSPCGRFLAACVACVLPHTEDPASQLQIHQDVTTETSPTRHPISAHQVVYELRIYSLEESTFGSVIASRAIRAAHCLTSIQFSPTSEHILLAYGRRHNSLLRSIVVDGEMTVPIYTILEVYRVSDMELVRVLPSAEDEVNVACFHPVVGGGLVYGTKEGKLRILQYDKSQSVMHANFPMDENMLEVQTYAMEG